MDLSIWLTLNFDFAPMLIKQGIWFLSVFISGEDLMLKGIIYYCSERKYVFWSEQLNGVPWIFFYSFNILWSILFFFALVESKALMVHTMTKSWISICWSWQLVYTFFGPPHRSSINFHTHAERERQRDFDSYCILSVSINQG